MPLITPSGGSGLLFRAKRWVSSATRRLSAHDHGVSRNSFRGDTCPGLTGRTGTVPDDGGVLDDIKRRVRTADLPDPVFAVLGALDLAVRTPTAAGRYYAQLVEHGHTRLVEVGTERAVRKRVGRVEQAVTPAARRWAVRHSQRQRRLRKEI